MRPSSPIHQGIVQGLSEFGLISRYYNLDFIVGGKATALPEPTAAWRRRVALPILDKHYSEAQRRKDDEWAIAALLPASIIHHAEDGSPIDDIVELMQ